MILCTRDKEKFIGATTVTVFINIRIERKYPYTLRRRRKGEVNKPLLYEDWAETYAIIIVTLLEDVTRSMLELNM